MSNKHHKNRACRPTRVKCPACRGTKKTHAFELKADCPWCDLKGHISLETERAFRAVKKLIPHEFAIIFGGFKLNPNLVRLEEWLKKKKGAE